MRIVALECLLFASGCAAQNDPELVRRISVNAALEDTRVAVTDFSKGLLKDNQFLGVNLCSIKINLALSANATRDNHAGLAVSGGVSGASVSGNASTNSSAADQRGNTVELVYQSGNIVACPPQGAAPATAKADETAKGGTKPGRGGGSAGYAALKGTCWDLDFREKHLKQSGETQTEWLRRICAGTTNLF